MLGYWGDARECGGNPDRTNCMGVYIISIMAVVLCGYLLTWAYTFQLLKARVGALTTGFHGFLLTSKIKMSSNIFRTQYHVSASFPGHWTKWEWGWYMKPLRLCASYRNILLRSLAHVMALHFGQSFCVPWEVKCVYTYVGHNVRCQMGLTQVQLTRACSQHCSQKTCQHCTDTSGLVYTSWGGGGELPQSPCTHFTKCIHCSSPCTQDSLEIALPRDPGHMIL